MFCIVIRDADNDVVMTYGPYKNINVCMARVDSLRDSIPEAWKFKIFNLYE